jgi:NAD(P)-dependent dehydrogenase (short-subunit alcohol dehydrogenase family)
VTCDDGLFAGRSVVVVGGTSGIGAAVAERFCGLGADVTAAGLLADEAPASLRAVADIVPLDLTVSRSVESLMAGARRLDILVNCAGIIRRGLEYEPDTFRSVLEVNLMGTMRACIAGHDLLKSSGGCIVNIASMLSFFGSAQAPAYSSSKGAIVQLTKSLAISYALDGIRVNAVAPGWIQTELTSALYTDAAADRRIVDRTPMGRWGTASDVAKAVTFLASDQAAFITGAVLPVDGGYHVA